MTHRETLIAKWQEKHTALLAEYNRLENEKSSISAGVDRISLRNEMVLVLSFIEDLKESTKIKESDLLPSHYIRENQPSYQGSGIHSVKELERLLEQYSEYGHQLRIEKQTLTKIANIEITK